MQKLQTDGCQWCTEGTSLSCSLRTLFLLFDSIWAIKPTISHCTLSTQAGCFSSERGVWLAGVLRGCLSFSKNFLSYRSLAISIIINNRSLFSQCTRRLLFLWKGGLAVGCVLRVPLFVLSSFLSLSFFISFFTLALSKFSPSLPISGSLYLSDRMETFWGMIRDVCWSHQKSNKLSHKLYIKGKQMWMRRSWGMTRDVSWSHPKINCFFRTRQTEEAMNSTSERSVWETTLISMSWGWPYSRVLVKDGSMIVGIVLRPWHWPHTPLPLENNHSKESQAKITASIRGNYYNPMAADGVLRVPLFLFL